MEIGAAMALRRGGSVLGSSGARGRALPREKPRQSERQPEIQGLVRDAQRRRRVQLPPRVQQKGAAEVDVTDVAAVLVRRYLFEGDFHEGAERVG